MEKYEVLTLLDIEQDAFYLAGNEIIQNQPQWNRKTDERVIVFAKFYNVISSTKLAIFFAEKYLTSPDWWKEFPHIARDNAPGRVDEFEQFVKLNYIQAFFSLTESVFRCFHEKLTPDTHAKGFIPFNTIFNQLLDKITIDINTDLRGSPILWREIRNSIHNNSIYQNQTRKNKTIIYRDYELKFEHGKPLNFVSWKLLLTLTSDMRTLLTEIIRSPQLSAIQEVDGPVNFDL